MKNIPRNGLSVRLQLIYAWIKVCIMIISFLPFLIKIKHIRSNQCEHKTSELIYKSHKTYLSSYLIVRNAGILKMTAMN